MIVVARRVHDDDARGDRAMDRIVHRLQHAAAEAHVHDRRIDVVGNHPVDRRDDR